jgi:hypothetical protein
VVLGGFFNFFFFILCILDGGFCVPFARLVLAIFLFVFRFLVRFFLCILPVYLGLIRPVYYLSKKTF